MKTAQNFSRFGAASLVASGKLLVRGHIANMFALLADVDWDVESYVASNETARCVAMRADIRALKDCKATASGHVKFAVSNAKGAAEFFAGVISRRDTYATESDMVKAAFVQAEAAGVTTGASLSRVLKGKTPHDVKPEKTTEQAVKEVQEKAQAESEALESAKVSAAIGMDSLFGDEINLAVVETANLSPVPAPAGTSLKERFAVAVAESDDSEWLTSMANAIAARLLAIEAATQDAIAKDEKRAKRAKRA